MLIVRVIPITYAYTMNKSVQIRIHKIPYLNKPIYSKSELKH